MKELLDAFSAFHVNGASYFLYALKNNWWLLLLAVGAIGSIIMSLREEIEVTVTEEQQIL